MFQYDLNSFASFVLRNTGSLRDHLYDLVHGNLQRGSMQIKHDASLGLGNDFCRATCGNGLRRERERGVCEMYRLNPPMNDVHVTSHL
jgi:hypothetical protein